MKSDALPAPEILCPRPRSFLRKFLGEGRWHLLPLYGLLRLSDLAREGIDHPGSARFADHLYRNRASGRTWFGRVLDRLLLSLPSSRSMRERCQASTRAMRAAAEAHFRSGAEENFRLLTVPCGLPRDVRNLAEECAAAATAPTHRLEYFGVDLDPEVLTEAEEMLAGSGLGQVSWQPGNALSSAAYPAEAVHFISSTGLGEFFDDYALARFFRQVFEALAPGGTFFLSALGQGSTSAWLLRTFEFHVRYRTEADLKRILGTLPWQEVRITRDRLGRQLFVRARKAPSRPPATEPAGVWVNDIHSELNATPVREVCRPRTQEELAGAISAAARRGESLALSGERHAMGGQQFSSGELLLDLRGLDRVISLDLEQGVIEAEAGLTWPGLLRACEAAQPEDPRRWTFLQKQSGADGFTLGGSVSANIHGRGLRLPPLVGQVEALSLVNAEGETIRCSRKQAPGLFRLAIGGYGLFGAIAQVRLRLARRHAVRRLVEEIRAEELAGRFEQRIEENCAYGDFQFCIDEHSPEFLQRGILSCYQRVEREVSVEAPRRLTENDWLDLLHLACTNRAAGYRRYADYYRATHGQLYWSDGHQMAPYLPNYAARLRARSGGSSERESLMISELFVPPARLGEFLREAAALLRVPGAPVIYGTVRRIEPDAETFLPWARETFAGVVLNLLVRHSPEGIAVAKDRFRVLIDLAIALGGSFYLTYHPWATRRQLAACYPQFGEFLARKREHDPHGRFQSDWYRHMRALWEGGDSEPAPLRMAEPVKSGRGARRHGDRLAAAL